MSITKEVHKEIRGLLILHTNNIVPARTLPKAWTFFTGGQPC